MNGKILIVDDDYRVNGLLQDIFEMEGYDVRSVYDGEEALAVLEKEQIDLLILDVMMPGLDGWEVLDFVKRQYETKVLMLTALSDEFSEVRGLRNGADEYISKPFRRAVLLERSKRLLEEYRKNQKKDMYFEGLRVCRSEWKVYTDDIECRLTSKEYQLLVLLMENHNIVLSREVILERIWGIAYDGNDRTIDTHIKMLRHSIGAYGVHIRTIRGIGYSFEGEVTVEC